MHTINVLQELSKYPVVDITKVADIIGKSNEYARLYLHRLKKRGLILQIEQGKYTVHKDPLLISTHLVWPSYLSLWTAFSHHKLTEQVPHDLWIVTTRKRKKSTISFCNTILRFIKTKPKYFFGYEKIRYLDADIFMAEKEKAIVDSILFRKLPMSIIKEMIVQNKKRMSAKRLISYAKRTGNKILVKKIRSAIGD